MIIPDVNVLVYAYRLEADHHAAYASWLNDVVAGDEDLGLVESVLTGLVRIVTNPRVVPDPAPTVDALAFVDALRGAPRARDLGASDASWARLRLLSAQDRAIRGNLVPDAQLAALALSHGGRVATADRGYARFPGLRWFDPLDRSPKLS